MNKSQDLYFEKDITNPKKSVSMEMVVIEGEQYYKITDNDNIRPFFMSIVSDSNHWMFISSNGGLVSTLEPALQTVMHLHERRRTRFEALIFDHAQARHQ